MQKPRYKIPLIGTSMVGKTSIAERLARGTFNSYKDSTIGAAYCMIRRDDFDIDLWDTAGQERYLSLVKFYLRYSDVLLFVVDVTNLVESFERLDYYLSSIDICKDIIVIGNKIDVLLNDSIDEIEKHTRKEFKKYEEKFNIYYINVSAKENINIDKLMELISTVCKSISKEIKEENLQLNNISTGYNYYNYCNC
ncbi:Ras family GTPase [uncultured virus]|nr:Ras family GTPase [uncultured virus]